MTIRLSLRNGIVLLAALLLLAAGIAYAVTSISRGVSGFVRVTADISVDEALALYEDVNGQPQTGSTLTLVDFGTVDLDPFSNPSQASRVTVWVENGGNTPYKLTVDDTSTGDGTGDDTFAFGEVLYARSGDALSTAPAPSIVLTPGDLIPIDLGLEFTSVISGDHTFTVRFRAEETGGAVPVSTGIVSWWPAENNALDIVGTSHGTLTGDATFIGGKVGQTFSFDGSGGYVDVSRVNIDFSTGITVEAWVKYNSFQFWSRIIDFGQGRANDNILFANEGTTNNLVLSQLGFGNCSRKRLRLLPFFRSVDVGGWQPWDENGMWSGWKGKNETSWND